MPAIYNKRRNCPMRHENGNCLPAGGFCTAVNDPICEALHNAFDHGKIAESERLHLDLIKQTREYEEERLEVLRKIHEKVMASQADAAKAARARFVDGACTNCGWFGDCVETAHYNFCPNCGAETSGKVKGDG